MTKAQLKSAYERYLASDKTSVTKAYKKPSFYKKDVEKDLLRYMNEKDGRNFRIISANPQKFTCGFVTDTLFYFITKENIYTLSL